MSGKESAPKLGPSGVAPEGPSRVAVRELAGQYPVEHRAGFGLVDIGRERHLGDEYLTGLGQHPLLPCRKALVGFAAGEVTDYFCYLVDVTGAELLDVSFETATPVRGHTAFFGLEYLEDFFKFISCDYVPNTDALCVIGRNHEGEVTVGQAKNVVLLYLSSEFPLLEALDYRCTVVRINDLVTNLKRGG